MFEWEGVKFRVYFPCEIKLLAILAQEAPETRIKFITYSCYSTWLL